MGGSSYSRVYLHVQPLCLSDLGRQFLGVNFRDPRYETILSLKHEKITHVSGRGSLLLKNNALDTLFLQIEQTDLQLYCLIVLNCPMMVNFNSGHANFRVENHIPYC